ncbi:MAG: hypothetical protein KIS74_04770 [Burkholderiales bacterium]|nr:hypothetical protein [Burkholderiales bacterium]
MVKRLVAMAIAALWMAQASAEAPFGVTVYPGAKADAAVTRDLKDKLKVNGFAYRTTDGVAKVAEFYRKQPPLKEMAVDKESAAFMNGPVMVTIQNPWMDMATGKMMKDTLISIVKN